jgi:hypothetical protein
MAAKTDSLDPSLSENPGRGARRAAIPAHPLVTVAQACLTFMPMTLKPLTRGNSDPVGKAVDKLVLATVNAPYRRKISGRTLAACLGRAEPADWAVHVATFFTDVSPRLIQAFAAAHGLSRSDLARAYLAMRSRTGERNPDLEAELGALASPAS